MGADLTVFHRLCGQLLDYSPSDWHTFASPLDVSWFLSVCLPWGRYKCICGGSVRWHI